jgi:hypothetical protein
MNVPRPIKPLPHESCFSGSNSGNKPYLVGPKKAACVLNRNTTASISGTKFNPSASVASNITPISATLTAMATLRLL